MDEIGVYLWSNTHEYNPKPLRPIDPSEKPQLVSNLPQMKTLLDDLGTDGLNFVLRFLSFLYKTQLHVKEKLFTISISLT